MHYLTEVDFSATREEKVSAALWVMVVSRAGKMQGLYQVQLAMKGTYTSD